MLAKTLALTTKLLDIADRREAARALARHFKADDLIIFIQDKEIGVSLPVAGFPQTFPHGALWQNFIKTCIENGAHTGESVPAGRPADSRRGKRFRRAGRFRSDHARRAAAAG